MSRLPCFSEKLLYSPDEPALQLVLILQAFGLYPSLALRALLPGILWRFVTADVNERRREEGSDLGQNVVQEFERLLVSRTENVTRDIRAAEKREKF